MELQPAQRHDTENPQLQSAMPQFEEGAAQLQAYSDAYGASEEQSALASRTGAEADQGEQSLAEQGLLLKPQDDLRSTLAQGLVVNDKPDADTVALQPMLQHEAGQSRSDDILNNSEPADVTAETPTLLSSGVVITEADFLRLPTSRSPIGSFCRQGVKLQGESRQVSGLSDRSDVPTCGSEALDTGASQLMDSASVQVISTVTMLAFTKSCLRMTSDQHTTGLLMMLYIL